MSTYASFQGRVFLGKRDIDGFPIEVRSPGNVAELKLSLKTEVLEHFESQSGQRSLNVAVSVAMIAGEALRQTGF